MVMVAGTGYTTHSQLFKKKLWNEKVAKEPKRSQIAKQNFWSQLLLKRTKFLVFGSKIANMATLVCRIIIRRMNALQMNRTACCLRDGAHCAGTTCGRKPRSVPHAVIL